MDITNYFKESINLYFGNFHKSYTYIQKKTNWLEVFLVGIIIGFLSGVISFIVDYNTTPQTFKVINSFGLGSLTAIYFTIFLLYLLFIPLSLLVYYGILHLSLKIFGGKANYHSTIKLGLSVAVLPSLIGLICSFIPENFVKNGSNLSIIILGLISVGVSVIVAIWSFVVLIQTYSELHKISTTETVLSILLPFILFVIFFIIYAISSGILPTHIA